MLSLVDTFGSKRLLWERFLPFLACCSLLRLFTTKCGEIGSTRVCVRSKLY
jgi:hypothetical protein